MSKQITTAKVLTKFLKHHRLYAAFCRDVNRQLSPTQRAYHRIEPGVFNELTGVHSKIGRWGYERLSNQFTALWNTLNVQPDHCTLADVVK